jgi:hypothetical protein
VVLSAEWRTDGERDAVLIVEDDTRVREALAANPEVLSRLLTETGDLGTWRGEQEVEANKQEPSTWGHLVIARASTGEVLTMDPERFWGGIYEWFRSRGVDYDTPIPPRR